MPRLASFELAVGRKRPWPSLGIEPGLSGGYLAGVADVRGVEVSPLHISLLRPCAGCA
jgi:hypothetical protein